jgi:hypothetical protein
MTAQAVLHDSKTGDGKLSGSGCHSWLMSYPLSGRQEGGRRRTAEEAVMGRGDFQVTGGALSTILLITPRIL